MDMIMICYLKSLGLPEADWSTTNFTNLVTTITTIILSEMIEPLAFLTLNLPVLDRRPGQVLV